MWYQKFKHLPVGDWSKYGLYNQALSPFLLGKDVSMNKKLPEKRPHTTAIIKSKKYQNTSGKHVGTHKLFQGSYTGSYTLN